MARKSPKSIAGLSRTDHLREKLIALETWLATADAKRNGAAYVAGIRQAVQLRADLEALENPATAEVEDPTVGLTDAEIANSLADALRALPVHMLDDVLDAIGAERIPRAAPTLKVIDGSST